MATTLPPLRNHLPVLLPIDLRFVRICAMVTLLVVGQASRPARGQQQLPQTSPRPPIMLFQDGETKDPGAAGGARTAFALMRLPAGKFAFYNRYAPSDGPISLPDESGQPHQLLPHLPAQVVNSQTILDSGVLNNTQVILTEDGAVLGMTVRNEPLDRETAQRVGLPRYLNTWFQRADSSSATEPRMTWRGYNGSQMEYEQLPGGRLLVPHGSFLPHARAIPPFGRHKTVIQFSDDEGKTWQLSPSQLVAPCYPGFNGSNEGACEPAIEMLADGRLWMLMRTSCGFLYEAFSTDNGTTWTTARASRFNTSTGPPNIMRHRNGWLAVCWNNCEMPPRHLGEGVYGGRDALHMAVSDDEGRTWRGFREIYLDHRRNDNPAKSGDRGTAYPLGAYTEDGQFVVIAGQGAGGRNPILIDPNWIVATTAETDFADGLKQWATYTHFGPARRWWRARRGGSRLVPHPDNPQRHCLHVRKQSDLPPDGATWNFPNGWQGTLTARVMLRDGFGGHSISLTDRFFDPANDLGEELSVFQAVISPNGKIADVQLPTEAWVTLKFHWDLNQSICQLEVDGKLAQPLALRHPTLNGVSYIRLRSTAEQTDSGGLLVDSVRVDISAPHTPPRTADELFVHEQRYVKNVVPRWAEVGK